LDFKQLIKKCINNDRRAQKTLFYRYAPLSMNVARRYVGSSAKSNDIVQESMIRVFHSLSDLELQQEAQFTGWIRKITSREAIRWLKKEKRFVFQEEMNPDLFEPTLPEEFNFQKEELMQLLMKLPEGYRTVFNLYVIEEYSHKEISQLLEITPSASRSQLTRARALLQKMMIQKNTYEKVS
jgi:RNA polymerase sigma-70 factor (ECF subfamily)